MSNEPVRFVNRSQATDAEVARAVSPERRAFLEEAFMSHLGPEVVGDVAGIVRSYAEGGHLNFNGVLYDTPHKLASFHRSFGFDGHGMLGDLSADLDHIHYTYGAVIVEYVMRGTVADASQAVAARRPVTLNVCGVYCFDEQGKLTSERIYLDTGSLLPQPVFRP